MEALREEIGTKWSRRPWGGALRAEAGGGGRGGEEEEGEEEVEEEDEESGRCAIETKRVPHHWGWWEISRFSKFQDQQSKNYPCEVPHHCVVLPLMHVLCFYKPYFNCWVDILCGKIHWIGGWQLRLCFYKPYVQLLGGHFMR